MARIVGLIGFPLKHSISPVFQQAAFDHLGLDVRYEAWETDPKDVAGVVARLREEKYLGMNVTVPFKEIVMPLLDDIDRLARKIGAVNTVVNRGGRLVGYNTDAAGFLHALREQARFDPKARQTLILGAGGAARAVAFALVEAGARPIYIANRTSERAEALAADLYKGGAPPGSIVPRAWTDARSLQGPLADSELIVNTTTIGMKHGPAEGESPVPAKLIPSRALVYDIVYNPSETPLLAEARSAGARTIGGLPMLVYQGAAAFELWTGRKAPVELMLAKAEAALS